jgi:aminotransferase
MTTKNKKRQGTGALYELIGLSRNFSDTIVLGIGDPTFDTPSHIVEAAKKAMREHANDYSPPEGILPLRQAIAERTKRVNNFDVDPETEVVVTNGGQEALNLMVLATVGPGDEMIVPDPNYNTYVDALNFAGGTKIDIPTYAHEDFRTDPERVRAAITDRSTVLLLVSPNNPTGAVISPEDMNELVQIALDHDLMILGDDIYDLFVYDGHVHTSPASLPGAAERTLTLNAVSKSYSMTGWRIGWIVGPADLMASVKKLKAAMTASAPIVSQYAAIAALTGSQNAIEEFRAAYVRRRKMVTDALDSMGMKYGVPQGGQFVFADISSTGMSSGELARLILEDQHVLVYPGSGFAQGADHFLRVTFLQPEDILQEGLDRMRRAMEKVLATAG